MVRQLMGVAPSLFCLEGGYDVDGSGTSCPHKPLRHGVAATVESMLEFANGLEGTTVSGDGKKVRDMTKQVVAQILEMKK
jgi:hypothetical protein